ncbi:type I restriction-modification system methyltransferase subunit [Gottschalkia purinilytica]|uniref:site-specific DNA-methyltransferase (adenine-specific) n=1 Tax=Gottschalkia purinilytica TaxID=1503 RepID=A0A0L0W7P9_GOTPU|nr:N-6 DNA methylase [Gottschalkia purinilytica]KNF07461.1 type I restriction-modification system methyltransferase subunit [Gottschalkia purinilytica]
MDDFFAAIDNMYEELIDNYGYVNIEEIMINTIIKVSLDNLGEAFNFEEDVCIKFIDNYDLRGYEIINNVMKKHIVSIGDLIPEIYVYILNKKGNKKEKYSIHYTPKWIVEYITNNVLKNIDIKDIQSMRILEPSCGSGVFLDYMFDYLFEIYKLNTNFSNSEIVKTILEKNLYGVDVDKVAIKISKFLMFLKALKKTKKYLDIKYNLFNCDFFKDNYIKNMNFDIILGNPPYVENRKINKYYDKKELKSNFVTAVGRFDFYSLFIEKSINKINDNGIISFIIPGSILYNNNFTPIRKLILDKTKIKEIVNLGEQIFEDVDMNMTILSLEESKDGISNIISCKDIFDNGDKQKHILYKKGRKIPQRYYYNTLNNVFDINSSETTFKLREKVFKNKYQKLSDVSTIVAGIATGNVKKKLVKNKKENKNYKRLLEGKDIFSYGYKWSGMYLVNDRSLINKDKGEYATFMKNDYIYSDKILIRQTSDRFICCYDDENYHLLNTLYSLIVKEDYKDIINLKYILALLNSKFYNFLYTTLVREKGKVFPQVKIFHIQNSPIITPAREIQQYLVNMVEHIILINKYLNSNRNYSNELKYKLQIKIEELKKEIDKVIYSIFELSFKEILEVERVMEKSTLDYDMNVNKTKNDIIDLLDKYKDIIKVSKILKVNPNKLYSFIFSYQKK